MKLNIAIAFVALSALVSSSAIPIKRDSTEDQAVSTMLSSLSSIYNEPFYASQLLSSALGYISSELPKDQKPIKQADLKSIVSKYGPEVAPSVVDGLISSALGVFSGHNLPSNVMSQLNSAAQVIKDKGGKPMSQIIVSALNKEAPEYRLEGDIGQPTAITNDEENDDSSKTSDASVFKMASAMIPVGAAAAGAITMLF
ncbi:hypothetical protein EV178_002928 [Coemansia sp. RSA 1646]|nr:hypothetical protein EV178_002928 [Coemansia sp. RSA 1646]KAJ1771718.1 hypothetical protein LPJ74_002145 [Coemansia sp. RSA 1843]KAJ2089645.1 hypothetical protein IW138_003243 [Coemansia sp. RSA 986]KAJ2210337.1 hypothetical protein EV179_006315 [Coemansia sp. RSA 487]